MPQPGASWCPWGSYACGLSTVTMLINWARSTAETASGSRGIAKVIPLPIFSQRMILRKYLAWASSTGILVYLSTQILPQGFKQIADWLGPVIGPTFRPEIHLIFLFIGPSLSYTPLLATWVTAGVVGGFFSRGWLRSMAAGTTSLITLALLIVGNGFLMLEGLRNLTSGASGFNLPPPPPGFNLAGILNAPVVSQIVQGLGSGGQPSIFSIIGIIAGNVAVNLSSYSLSFNISGFLFGRLFRKREARTVPMPVGSVDSPLPKPGDDLSQLSHVHAAFMKRSLHRISLGKVALAMFLLSLSVSILIIPAGRAQSLGLPSDFSGEQLVLQLDKDGALRMAYSTNGTALPGVPSDYSREEFQGLVGGFVLASNGTIDLGDTGPLSFLITLLPPTGFLAIYQTSDSAAGRARADTLASEFGQGFGLTLQPIVHLDLGSFGGQQIPGGPIHLAIYSSNTAPRNVAGTLLSLVQADGVGSILTPEKVFINHYTALAGFVNFNLENTTRTLEPVVAVIADLTPLGNFFGRGIFTLGLRETFGPQGTIEASTITNSTLVHLLFPANSTVTSYGPPEASVNGTLGEFSLSMNSTSGTFPNAYVTFNGTFPQNIQIDRRLDPASPFPMGTVVTEKISVRNLGNETIQSAKLSEMKLFQAYPTLELLSTSYNITLGDIQAQSSAETTLQFKVNADGTYTLPPLEISYLDQGEMIRKTSSRAYMTSSFDLFLYLGELVSGTSPYSYLLIALAVLPPILQVLRLARRRSPGTAATQRF